MFKSDQIAAALACVAVILATAPAAHAASRVVEFSQSTFQNRCLAQAGELRAGAGGITCETLEAEVRCNFIELNLADCDWAGVDHQRGVNRIIGMASADSVTDLEGGMGGNRPPRWRHRVVSF